MRPRPCTSISTQETKNDQPSGYFYPGDRPGGALAVYMPSSTPQALQQALHDAIHDVIARPGTKPASRRGCADLRPRTQAWFIAFHDAEYQRYGGVIRQNDIPPDRAARP